MESTHVAVQEVQEHQLVIAEHRVEPWLFDQRQCCERLRPAVDQVANRQDAVATRVESQPVEFLLEQGAMAVEVTNDQISALRIPWKAKAALDPGNLRHDGLSNAVPVDEIPSWHGVCATVAHPCDSFLTKFAVDGGVSRHSAARPDASKCAGDANRESL